jgi:hypothetical protein
MVKGGWEASEARGRPCGEVVRRLSSPSLRDYNSTSTAADLPRATCSLSFFKRRSDFAVHSIEKWNINKKNELYIQNHDYQITRTGEMY